MDDKINEKAIKKASVSELHGHTKITLTDVKTGEKEIIEKDNLVTEAVANLFFANLFGQMDYKDLIPVRDLFGGVLCFEDAIPITAINPTRSNRMVANAGQTAHSSESTTRGNPNGGESQQLSNGYKFVWDFPTNVVGTINALALTHKWAGDAGLKPIEANANEPLIKFSTNKTHVVKSGTNSERKKHTVTYSNLIYISPDGSWGYHANGTTINKIRTYGVEQYINNELGNAEVLESKTFTIGSFTAARDSVTYDVENDKILFVVMGLDTAVTITSVDFDSEETETIEITQGINLDRTSTSHSTQTWLDCALSCNRWIKSGKYIHLPASNGNFYRIDLTNPTDITELISYMGETEYNFNLLGQVNIGDGLVMGANYIVSNDGVYPIENPSITPLFSGSSPSSTLTATAVRVARSLSADVANLVWIEFLTGGATANVSTFYMGVALILPYLATIQNLNQTVVKTSDKTMKIEYTITNNS